MRGFEDTMWWEGKKADVTAGSSYYLEKTKQKQPQTTTNKQTNIKNQTITTKIQTK